MPCALAWSQLRQRHQSQDLLRSQLQHGNRETSEVPNLDYFDKIKSARSLMTMNPLVSMLLIDPHCSDVHEPPYPAMRQPRGSRRTDPRLPYSHRWR